MNKGLDKRMLIGLGAAAVLAVGYHLLQLQEENVAEQALEEFKQQQASLPKMSMEEARQKLEEEKRRQAQRPAGGTASALAPDPVATPPIPDQSPYLSRDEAPEAGLSEIPMAVQSLTEVDQRLRDPFKRPAVEDLDKGKVLTELEKISLDQLKVVGVVTGLQRPQAVIAGPDSKTHIVTLGTRIGVRQGVVTSIQTNGIVVREKLVNPLGQERNVDVNLLVGGESESAD